jgi:hypothetical protein
MSKRITSAEYLASMNRLLDRSTQALERCLDHMTEIEGRIQRDRLARAQTGWPASLPRSTSRAPLAAPARDPSRHLHNR